MKDDIAHLARQLVREHGRFHAQRLCSLLDVDRTGPHRLQDLSRVRVRPGKNWPVRDSFFFLNSKRITKDLSSSEAGLLHSKRASSTQMSPYKWRNRFLRLERNQTAGLHMHCMATNAENVCLWVV